MSRLKECFCGCSVRTGTFVVLWIDSSLSAIMAMVCLAAGYGMSAAIDLFQSLAQYAYNAAKFFYHQTKSFGGDANIEDFETLLKASQSIDPTIENLAKIYCTFLFYWNFFFIIVAIVGLVAVHQRKQYLLMPFLVVKIIETAVYIFVIVSGCYKISLPSFWLIGFPGLINIGVKIYFTLVVYSYCAELRYFQSKKRGPDNDSECGKDIPLKRPLNC